MLFDAFFLFFIIFFSFFNPCFTLKKKIQGSVASSTVIYTFKMSSKVLITVNDFLPIDGCSLNPDYDPASSDDYYFDKDDDGNHLKLRVAVVGFTTVLEAVRRIIAELDAFADPYDSRMSADGSNACTC